MLCLLTDIIVYGSIFLEIRNSDFGCLSLSLLSARSCAATPSTPGACRDGATPRARCAGSSST
eukprot:328275-Pyramimonas_sp.AAC.1